MEFFDVAMIMFSCVMFIHMGLADAFIEAYNATVKDVPIITCPKCLTFWCVLAYMIVVNGNIVNSIATSFIASYSAIWLDLLLGKLDVIYEKISDSIREEDESEDASVLHETDRNDESKDDKLSEV